MIGLDTFENGPLKGSKTEALLRTPMVIRLHGCLHNWACLSAPTSVVAALPQETFPSEFSIILKRAENRTTSAFGKRTHSKENVISRQRDNIKSARRRAAARRRSGVAKIRLYQTTEDEILISPSEDQRNRIS